LWEWGFSIQTAQSINLVAALNYVLDIDKFKFNGKTSWKLPLREDIRKSTKFTENIAEWNNTTKEQHCEE
jgi:hypothetical protein